MNRRARQVVVIAFQLLVGTEPDAQQIGIIISAIYKSAGSSLNKMTGEAAETCGRASAMYKNYFKCAVWLPAIVLPLLLIADAVWFSRPLQGGVEQYFLVYVLGFGLAGYLAFAIFASRMINRRSAREVLRLAWWAPMMFIPFYGVPWVLYGLGYLMFGRIAGIGVMFLWLAYLPYVLGLGYVFSAASVYLYKMIAR